MWLLELPLFLLRCFHSSHTKSDKLCSIKINGFGLLFWFPFLHICNFLDTVTLSSLGMMFCRFVLIFKFRTRSFDILPRGSVIDKNLFLQALPIFYETTKLSLIKWISSKPQHPWSQKGMFIFYSEKQCLWSVPTAPQNKTWGLVDLLSSAARFPL